MASRSHPLRPSAHRVAGLQLRGRAAPVATRVYWPAPPTGSGAGRDAVRPPALVVLVPGRAAAGDAGDAGDAERIDALAHGLCASVGVVVLGLQPSPGGRGDGPRDDEVAAGPALDDASTVLHWAADHARELGADARRLVVAGWSTGAVRAAMIARHAAEHGWPEIVRQVLICPDSDSDSDADAYPDTGPRPDRSVSDQPYPAAGVAPATVVTVGHDGPTTAPTGPGLAVRLRQAGVPVDEVRTGGLPPGEPAWAPWSEAADRVMADLARSLRRRLEAPPGAVARPLVDDRPVGEVRAP